MNNLIMKQAISTGFRRGLSALALAFTVMSLSAEEHPN